VIRQPFSVLAHALQATEHWCDILILHINVKACKPHQLGSSEVLRVAVGRKFDQALSSTHLIEFDFRVSASDADYLAVMLSASHGPLRTRDYRIGVQVVANDQVSGFLKMSYSYRYGVAARVAMQLYLSTIAREKVGFSIVYRECARP
jgi:hypothetical protein